MSKVIAIFCSDLHLSSTPPIARSAEPDWWGAQKRILDQLYNLESEYQCSIICAGDIFDKWNCSPELINWAIENLPEMIAIPGQHDLPLHRYEDVRKSAYYSMVLCNRICPLEERPFSPRRDNLWLSGFPWGFEVKPPNYDNELKKLSVAIIHKYIWISKHNYPNAPEEDRLLNFGNCLSGYDIAIFGDNHSGFLTRLGKTQVLNCGCLIPRKLDERYYKPAVGLLHEDGKITRHYLDTSQDKWIENEEEEMRLFKGGAKLAEFIEELKSIEGESLDFCDAVRRYIGSHKVCNSVKRILLEEIEGGMK